ncbi:MAG TPA: S8 family serine peptidase [Longimicrobiales bacterium]
MTRVLPLAVVAVFAACAAEPGQQSVGLQDPGVNDRIDPALRTAASADARVPVLILGREQLLPGGNAYADFVTRHSSADRLNLRASVVSDLKEISRRHATPLAAALPGAARATRLWIVNGIMALLTREEIERTAADPAVAYLYLLDRVPGSPQNASATLVAPAAAAFDTAGKRIAWNITRIGAPAAWSQGHIGSGVVVAMIDGDVAISHRDLSNNIWVNDDEIANNGVDDDHNGYVDDRHGFDFSAMSPDNGQAGVHGTYVAGIIAGDGSGGIITGAAPRARLMPLVGISFGESALAMQYALDNGADIVNMSFSIPNLGALRSAWRMAADHAVAAGLVLVSGAGNFQQTAPIPVQLRIPEDIPSVIAVGGIDENERVTGFSSLGPVEWGSVPFYRDHPLPAGLVKPDVVAFPGAGYPLLSANGGYIDPNFSIRGNSFSSPQAAGAAALLLSARPGTPAWKISEILQSSARDLEPAGKDNRTGRGVIDITAALRQLN